MNAPQAALYARGSSAQQAEADTGARQVVAWRERIAADGRPWSEALPFLDAGSRGATRVRPALARWRAVATAGAGDRLAVPSPDRRARQDASHGLLVAECPRLGGEVLCLNREGGRSPEDDLRLHVQGRRAASERAKMSERHRRGRRHAARAGTVNGCSGAPEGDRDIPPDEGQGQAR